MPRHVKFPLAIGVLALATAARADIFQWEYINPADPGQGKQQSTMLAPDGAGVNAVPGANLYGRNLTMAYLIGADLTNAFAFASNLSNADLSHANLTNATFQGAWLTGADFTGAEVRCASFSAVTSEGPRGTGITPTQLYSTASYQARDLTGIQFWGNDLTDGNFAGQNLTNARFDAANLTDADFNGAVVRGANFASSIRGVAGTGITLTQLYPTASYQTHDLSGINLMWNNLSAGNFVGQNLANAYFGAATLTDADFTAADARGADLDTPASAITTNLIRPDGHISRLDLNAGGLLIVRDYDGNPSYPFGDPIPPIPIAVDQHFVMGPGGTLRTVFETDAWDSTISFAPGIPVTLGGTLELTYAPGVNLAGELGRTLDLFDWTGVNPTGAFAISSPYAWDLSHLYTTGEVTLLNLLVPGDLNNDGIASAADISALMAALADLGAYESSHGLSEQQLLHVADLNGDNHVTNADIQGLINQLANSPVAAVPEPSAAVLAAVGALALLQHQRKAAKAQRA